MHCKTQCFGQGNHGPAPLIHHGRCVGCVTHFGVHGPFPLFITPFDLVLLFQLILFGFLHFDLVYFYYLILLFVRIDLLVIH